MKAVTSSHCICLPWAGYSPHSPAPQPEGRGEAGKGWGGHTAVGSVQGEQELRRLTADLAAPICQLSVDTQPESEAGVGCQWAGGLG